ncbi:MAG: extracellular solute-binding protein [Acholeplasmataceae bacterium]|nr:extracellular solute-binding protein [Acholeplasmataceae bacterium]
MIDIKKIIIISLSILGLILVVAIVDSIVVKMKKDTLLFNREPVAHINPAELGELDPNSYFHYLTSNPEVYPQNEMIQLDGAGFDAIVGNHRVLDEYEGVTQPLLTEEKGRVSWTFEIPWSGFYHLKLKYFPYPGKSSSIERRLYINDEVPFDGANNLVFYRIWQSQGDEVKRDIHGNDIRPSQIENPFWTEALFKDAIGYVNEPYAFYFQAGPNTITLESVREPLLIDKIEIISVEQRQTYAEVYQQYLNQGYEKVKQDPVFLQAEDAAYTTSPTLYPLNDRTSQMTMPSHHSLIRLNTIGGANWRVAGDQISWEFNIDEAGLYAISLRVKQKIAAGMNVSRNIYIDGKIPFKEFENFQFPYSNDWRIQTLGSNDDPYYLYFSEGKHVITFEISLGEYGPIIAQVQNSINQLNKLYREILVYTGPEPDPYRDYELTRRVDRMLERLEEERNNLVSIRERIIEISGSTSEKTGILDTFIIQLDDFLEKPRKIHRNLFSYSANISALGTLVILMSEQPLEIDYFVIHHENETMPQNKASWISRMWFSLRSFFASFVTNYAAIGQTEAGGITETIEVWISVGRDQTNILRKLIDESFTPNTGIQVDLKLVNAAVLLPATLSGVGPDVAMGVGYNVPVNYAMRNAVYDLSQEPEFDMVKDRFMDSAMTGFKYEGGTFALPEQQIFLMMFYRTDIFEEMGFSVPHTWRDVIEMIPDLQKHNLEFYLPVPISQGNVINLPPNPIFATMFYQNDGEFYINDNLESGFNEGLGPEVFETWTRFYTDYSFPVEANFVNRFRSGQMPIGVTYYNTYNTLSVFAPEIRGKWDFTTVPGTITTDEHGNEVLRKDTVSTNTGVMIMEQSQKKAASWKFLEWWTRTEIQVQFGREMEGILGAAARYPTANIEALTQLPWTVEEYEKLQEQWAWVKGVPEVPGGYMTGRHLDNAFRLVINENANPRETIYDYVLIINEEMMKKRREFGLID